MESDKMLYYKALVNTAIHYFTEKATLTCK